MLMLAQIDLSHANLSLFEESEATVLALLGKYGARLEERLRSTDGQAELHLLYFVNRRAKRTPYRRPKGTPLRSSVTV